MDELVFLKLGGSLIGELISMETEPIELMLRHGLAPLVYGDVALDEVRGCTIISTEQVFALERGNNDRSFL